MVFSRYLQQGILLCFWLIALPGFCLADEIAWQLKEDADGVKVWQRKNKQALWEIKATTQVRAELGALILLLRDTDNAETWIDRCAGVELLFSEDMQDIVVTTFQSPWPFADRIMLTQSTVELSQDSLTIKVTGNLDEKGFSKPAYFNQFVAMRRVSGQWTVRKINEEEIDITYAGTGDPAGSIPSWLAKGAMVESTFNTFKSMRHEIIKTKYQTKPKT